MKTEDYNTVCDDDKFAALSNEPVKTVLQKMYDMLEPINTVKLTSIRNSLFLIEFVFDDDEVNKEVKNQYSINCSHETLNTTKKGDDKLSEADYIVLTVNRPIHRYYGMGSELPPTFSNSKYKIRDNKANWKLISKRLVQLYKDLDSWGSVKVMKEKTKNMAETIKSFKTDAKKEVVRNLYLLADERWDVSTSSYYSSIGAGLKNENKYEIQSDLQFDDYRGSLKEHPEKRFKLHLKLNGLDGLEVIQVLRAIGKMPIGANNE